MKKLGMILLALMLVFALVFGLVVSCGGDDDSTPAPKPKPAKCECGKDGCACTTACPADCQCACCKDPVIINCEYCGYDYVEGTEVAHFNDCYCPNPECLQDWADCEDVFIWRELKIIQDGTDGLPTVPEGERVRGKGFINSYQFAWTKTVKPGSKIRLMVSDTGSSVLGWATVGSIGVGNLDNNDGRIQFAPQADDFIVTFDIEDFWRINGFEDATFGNVNTWGDVITNAPKINGVFLLIEKENIGVQNISEKDFYINASLVHFLDVAPVPAAPVAIRPRFNMTQGAITIKYNGSTTVPTTVGSYPVTFDVAAAAGYNGATNLVVGSLEVNAKAPFFLNNVVGDMLTVTGPSANGQEFSFGGFNVANFKAAKSLLIETKQPAGLTGQNTTRFPQTVLIVNGSNWAETTIPQITIPRAEGDTIYLVIHYQATHDIPGNVVDWAGLEWRNWSNNFQTFGVVRAYLIDENLARPTDGTTADIGTGGNFGYAYKP